MATSSIGFEQAMQTAISSTFQEGNWLATCVLSLLLSAVMSSLAWMISNAFQSNELKAWAKRELSEFIFTGALIGISAPLLVIISYLTIAYVGGDPYTLAGTFLDKAQADLVETYSHIVSLKAIISVLSTFELKVGWIMSLLGLATFNIVGIGSAILAILSNLTLNYGSPFAFLIAPFNTMESFMRPMFFAMFVQHELLNIIQKTMLPVVLPLGILLRAFPLSRRAGSTLIAIALAAYIIYPLTLVFADSIYTETKQMIGSVKQLPTIDSSVVGVYMKISPSAGKYYLNESDIFKWQSLVPLNYSIWTGISCLNIPTGVSFYLSEAKNPDIALKNIPSNNYVYWKVIQEDDEPVIDQGNVFYPKTVSCYKRAGHGSVDVGKNITRTLDKNVFEIDKRNELIFITFSEQNSKTYIENISFYFGDPCKETLWSRFFCLFSTSYAEKEINDVNYLNLFGSGIKGAFGATSSVVSSLMYTVGESSPASLFLTPVTAGYVFLYLTDNIAAIIFPALIIFFTFVISISVFVISFKSISQTIGGETKIIELGRLI